MIANRATRFGIFGIVTLILTGGCGPAPTGDAATEILVVGAIAPLTGDGAAYGTWAQRGVELALEDVTPPGAPAPVRVQWEDSRLDPAAAISAYLKLTDVDGAPIVIGPLTSGETRAVLPQVDRKQVPILSPSATADEFRDAGDWFFRVCPTNLAQAAAAAGFAFDTLAARTAFVLFEEIAYGSDLAAAFITRFEALGGQVVGRDSFREGETDYRALIQQVDQADPDVLYAPSNYTEAATLLRQLDQLDVGVPVLGGDGAYGDSLLEIAGPTAEGTYWTTIAWGAGPAQATADRFEARYRERFGDAPHQFAGLYYDAARIVFDTVDATMDPSEVRIALLSMPAFHGATGTTAFDERGQVDKAFAVYQVASGAYVQVAP